jgi:hypothetical protein
MQHCYNHWDNIFDLYYRDELFSIFKSSALVRNIILAIGACHLRHMTSENLQHRIAEYFQQFLAIQDYRKALITPLAELGQSGVNVLLLGATLLNILAFPLSGTESGSSPRLEHENSWMLNTRDDRKGWIGLQAGIRPVLRSAQSYFSGAISFLTPLFLGPNASQQPAINHGLDGVPISWRKFFDLERLDGQVLAAGTGCRTNVFRELVCVTAYLRTIEPISANIFQYFTFFAKANPRFSAMLYEMDEKALWLYGYWFGLICRFESMWWCRERARRDYEAIRSWFRQLHVTERPGLQGITWSEMMIEFEMASVQTSAIKD